MISHNFALIEIEKYKELICSKLNINDEKFERIKTIISKLIEFEEISPQQINRAKQLIPDEKDAPYLALALKHSIPLWSNDKHFKEQNKIAVYNTEELNKILSEKN